MLKNLPVFALISVLLNSAILYAQPLSAIEFYDSTGTSPISKFGWQGSAAAGHFFIAIPGAPGGFKLQNGNLTLGGSITAIKFVGDGSGLTNLPAQAVAGTGSSAAEVAAVLMQNATFLESVKGEPGTAGVPGADGEDGVGPTV